jgi:hypothetical protein
MTDRTCANCACFYQHPIPVPNGQPEQKQSMCRLNPPITVQQILPTRVAASSRGDQAQQMRIALSYAPTAPELTCWQWIQEGSLPGDRAPPENMEQILNAMLRSAAE